MKLKELQDLIFDDLIIDCGKFKCKDVYKYGGVFESLKNSEVIGLRHENNYLVISVR